MFINVEQYRLYNDQLSNMWQLNFLPHPELDFHIVDTNLPFPKLEAESRGYGEAFYSGFTPVETVSFTFRCTENFNTFDFFQDWLEDIYDYNNNVFKTFSNNVELYTKKYKNANITFLKKKGGHLLNIPSKSFNLLGLMPLGFSEISLTNDNGEPLEFTVEMTVEQVIPVD